MKQNCGNCANYDREKEAYADICGKCVIAYVEGVEQEPSQWRALPQTNADRIRAMSDEGLVDLIFQYDLDERIDFCKEKPECICALEEGKLNPRGNECRKCMLEWMRRPADQPE